MLPEGKSNPSVVVNEAHYGKKAPLHLWYERNRHVSKALLRKIHVHNQRILQKKAALKKQRFDPLGEPLLKAQSKSGEGKDLNDDSQHAIADEELLVRGFFLSHDSKPDLVTVCDIC